MAQRRYALLRDYCDVPAALSQNRRLLHRPHHRGLARRTFALSQRDARRRSADTQPIPVGLTSFPAARHAAPVTAYRPDIDGLRAVAVVAVVLFHARLGPVGGGFVGVDVFFVISGYLITGIIFDDITAGTFSITTFYERRMRRLLPALIAVLSACTLAGYALLLPDEFRRLGQSVAAASAFVSNFHFWSQAGYFDKPQALKPLLHTWSLGVEEQFYLFFPPFLLVVSKYTTWSIKRVLLIVALISFGFSAIALVKHPDTAFYLPHTRLWELMIGALLVVTRYAAPATRRMRTLLGFLGLGLIGVSIFAYSSNTLFPGPAALLPCIGTALIIHAGRNGGSVLHCILATRPLVHVGLISYSLYLWHWPILTFARAIRIQPLTSVEAVALVVLSLAVAELSWRFVESPFRSVRGRVSRRQIFALGGVATVAILLTGATIALRGGIPARVPREVAIAEAGALDEDRGFRRRCSNFTPEQVAEDVLCKLGASQASQPTFLLWGDSHAYALAPIIAAVAHDAGKTGLFAGAGGCAPLLGVSNTPTRAFPCEAFNDSVIALIRRNATLQTVFIASRWTLAADGRRNLNEGGADRFVRDSESGEVSIAENQAVFRRGLARTLTALHAAGKNIVLIGPVPEIGFDVPTTLARSIWFNDRLRIEPSLASFFIRQRFVMHTQADLQRHFGFRLIQPYQALCDNMKCSVGGAEHPLYIDDNHLSITGTRVLRPLFEPAFALQERGNRDTR